MSRSDYLRGETPVEFLTGAVALAVVFGVGIVCAALVARQRPDWRTVWVLLGAAVVSGVSSGLIAIAEFRDFAGVVDVYLVMSCAAVAAGFALAVTIAFQLRAGREPANRASGR